MRDLRQHAGLLEQLGRARALGFLGPGPIEGHIDHTTGFVTALEGVVGTVVDLGSGGGVPGFVIGIARPDLHLVLVESRAKRAQFLDDAARILGLDAEIVAGRAEVIGRSERRGSADAVVARSFGPPSATAECGAPLLRSGGWLVVSEPPPPPRAGRWPVEGLRRLGLVPRARIGTTQAVQMLEQIEPCPDAFPRREGVPTKQPLF